MEEPKGGSLKGSKGKKVLKRKLFDESSISGEHMKKSRTDSLYPQLLDVSKLVSARRAEITEMKRAFMNQRLDTKRVFQRLPRHLRRRTASFNYHRLPRRARAYVRLHERDTLLERRRKLRRSWIRFREIAYERRMEKTFWLETHKWHAKRFRIETILGANIPVRRSDKATRACWKFIREASTIHDASYMFPVELKSVSLDLLLTVLNRHLSLEDFIRASTSQVTKGIIRCQAEIRYSGLDVIIAPVSILFGKNSVQKNVSLWFWVHYFAYSELLEELNRTIDELNKRGAVSQSEVDEGDNLVEVRERKGEIVLFEIRGRKTHDILKDLLRAGTSSNQSSHCGDFDIWTAVSDALGTSSNIPTGSIFSMDTVDPTTFSRQSQSFCQTKVKSRVKGNKLAEKLNKWMTRQTPLVSDLLDEEFRAGLNERRDVLMKQESEDVPLVPILLIQYPGHPRSGQGAGYDILVPRGYGMKFWMGLVYRGAKAVGTDERHLFYREGLMRSFPSDFPGTRSHLLYSKLNNEKQQFIQARKPPGKRVNYEKLRITSPFSADFPSLFPLRETPINVLQPGSRLIGRISSEAKENSTYNTLFPVAITMVGRSSPRDCSIIYSANENDVQLVTEAMKSNRKRTFKAVGHISKSDKEDGKAIGIVTSGGYSFKRGKGSGVGFCSFIALKTMITTKNCWISKDNRTLLALVRHPCSAQYYTCLLSTLDMVYPVKC